ncbi:3-demethylubiquinol 3-O-methyltransferase @ 2-polyprenyl-6-hydroxyphenyl methylase [hydrothermal vent metagenome]|uniref:3-demethylubiquinol 3-O-methyltransferase @ 2-polyprenyl-6-hydroxyphenyl methylase n=1 Tax=hydrothermal vent metagenome TaxID=652676 RepID=A0A3B0S5Q6_9ZZZZ
MAQANEKPNPAAMSIDPQEVAKFAAMADEWWDPKGKFKPLHEFNPVRLKFIRQQLLDHFDLDPKARQPLQGLRLLDIGCGGGLLSIPMARLGADVLGVDAAAANVGTASHHAKQIGVDVQFLHGSSEALLAAGEQPFDVILNMEVIEHTADRNSFLQSCSELLSPGGIMIVATLNRTQKAKALAIFAAEQILRWLPPGTHEYEKLVRPEEIREPLQGFGLTVDGPFGVSFNPFTRNWSESRDVSVNYMMVAKK